MSNNNTQNSRMSDHEVDLATKLLRSSDSKVAAAAMRIFSRSIPATSFPNAGTNFTVSPTAESGCESFTPHVLDSNTKLNLTDAQSRIPADVQEAASAVAMLAPQHRRLSGSSSESRSLTPTSTVGFQVPVTTSMAVPPFHQVSESPPLKAGDHLVSHQIPMKKQSTPSERLKRSRERNKMHARKTRQRKKEHMQILEKRVDELKRQQISLKQHIEKKSTANILLGMFSTSSQKESIVDPKVDELMKRAVEDIPDASKIPELPALILPGQHNNKRKDQSTISIDGSNGNDFQTSVPVQEFPDDGIDYKLLGKDRSKCTPDELDQIRKERNRMHAKRTRDRKRIFMEEMEEMIRQLKDENQLLQEHLVSLTADQSSSVGSVTPSLIISPTLKPSSPSLDVDTTAAFTVDSSARTEGSSYTDTRISQLKKSGSQLSQVRSVLYTSANENQTSDMEMPILSSGITTVSDSPSDIVSQNDAYSQDSSMHHPHKRQRIENPGIYAPNVPSSITTSSPSTTTVGC